MLKQSSDQRRLFAEIVDFAKQAINPGVQERRRNRQFSRELWEECGRRIGLQGLPATVRYGGRDANASTTAYALEALGYGCEDSGFAFAVGAHLLACVVPVLHHGSAAQHDRYLHALSTGALVGCNAMTEVEGGSDIFAIRTTAQPVAEGYLVNGTKCFITNAPEADLAIVYARSNSARNFIGGLSAVIVDASLMSKRVTIEQQPLETCPIGNFVLDNVLVHHDDGLGGEGNGAAVFNSCMAWERMGLAAMHVGRMRRVLEYTIAFAKRRKAAGESITRFQAVTNRIANMKIKTEAAAALTYRAAAKMDGNRMATIEAAEAKLFTSEAFVDVCLDAMKTLSSTAVLAECPIGDCLLHAMAATNYSGTNDVQRNIISKWLLCE